MRFRDILKNFISGLKSDEKIEDNSEEILEKSNIPELMEEPTIQKRILKDMKEVAKEKKNSAKAKLLENIEVKQKEKMGTREIGDTHDYSSVGKKSKEER